jgi:hypothetical protein
VEHEALLVGLREDEAVALTILVDGEPACDGDTTASTTHFTTQLSAGDVRVSTPDSPDAGLALVPVVGPSGSGAALFDEGGEMVWLKEIDGPGRPVLRALPSLDGKAVLYNESAAGLTRPGMIYRAPLDGGEPDVLEIEGAHTDFVEWAPGRFAFLGWEIREFDGRRLVGDRVLEVDEAGVVTELWNSFDAIEVDLSREYERGWFADDPTAEDWTHVNSITYAADEDAYYLTMTLDDAVARIERDSGRMSWRLANGAGEFAVAGEPPPILRPHSVQRLDGTLLVFSRGPDEGPDMCSRAVEVAYDEQSWEAAEVWAYEPETCTRVAWLGSAQRLPGGNTLSCFSSAGQLDEVDASGALVMRTMLPAGSTFGFAVRVVDPVGGFPSKP